MAGVRSYKYTIGTTKQELHEFLSCLRDFGFYTRYNGAGGYYQARKRIRDYIECHIIIKKVGGKYRAYLHIDYIIQDSPHLIHRAERNYKITREWGRAIFKKCRARRRTNHQGAYLCLKHKRTYEEAKKRDG